MNWPRRLVAAAVLLDRMERQDLNAVPPWYVDQIQAAYRDTRTTLEKFGVAIRRIEPDRAWTKQLEIAPTRAQKIHLLAAMLDVNTICCHLRGSTPRPAHVRLALHRADCGRCIATIRKPPADEDDRCDYCGRRGVVTFFPIALTYGHMMLMGDACDDCAAALKADKAA